MRSEGANNPNIFNFSPLCSLFCVVYVLLFLFRPLQVKSGARSPYHSSCIQRRPPILVIYNCVKKRGDSNTPAQVLIQGNSKLYVTSFCCVSRSWGKPNIPVHTWQLVRFGSRFKNEFWGRPCTQSCRFSILARRQERRTSANLDGVYCLESWN